jgi:ETFB lysine methyltransferase
MVDSSWSELPLLSAKSVVTIGRVSNFDSPDTQLKPDAASLEARLRTRFAIVEHQLVVAGRPYQLRHPRSADELICEEEFNRDERLPYWAEFWPSAYVLAERIALEEGNIDEGGRGRGRRAPGISSINWGLPSVDPSHPPKRRLLELGCGSGLAVMTALAAGIAVTAIDYYPEALEFVRLNALINGLPMPETRVADWRKYPSDLVDFDIVIAADVLYERGYCRLMAAAFKQSLRAGGHGILTDPQRTKAASLPDECRSAGLSISEPQVFGPLSVPGGDPSVKQTVNLFEIRHVARDRQFEC